MLSGIKSQNIFWTTGKVTRAAREQRDPKGLYKNARAGQIKEFTGISAPYEPPLHPEVIVHTDRQTLNECVAQIMEYLKIARFERDSFAIEVGGCSAEINPVVVPATGRASGNVKQTRPAVAGGRPSVGEPRRGQPVVLFLCREPRRAYTGGHEYTSMKEPSLTKLTQHRVPLVRLHGNALLALDCDGEFAREALTQGCGTVPTPKDIAR